jgi:hypothetical protein
VIEKVDVPALLRLVDDERVARGLSQAGMTATGRLRALAECRWYRDGDVFCVFRPEVAGSWSGLVFSVEPEEFAGAALDALFSDATIDRVTFMTSDPESGRRLGAAPLGRFMMGGNHAWFVSRADWLARRKVGASAMTA